MRNHKREIECLKRLQEISPIYEELVQFLIQELLLDKEEYKNIKTTSEQARVLQAKLFALCEQRKLQLLEYEWHILPVEHIRLTMVSTNGFKEFIAEV